MADDEGAGLLHGIHVLIVDDDADVRDVLDEVFRDSGALVTSASSPRAALPLIPLADVIVAELSMPSEDDV